MDKARYLVEAHLLEGRSVSELAAGPRGASQLDLQAFGPLQGRWLWRSSLIRFQAELPNEMWQADITHWRLAGEGHVEILNLIDDHSRLFLASRAFPTVKAADVVEVFRGAIALHGAPASLLCDNGAVFTATPRGGKVLLQSELERGAQALPGKPGCGEDARAAAGTARRLRALLQHD